MVPRSQTSTSAGSSNHEPWSTCDQDARPDPARLVPEHRQALGGEVAPAGWPEYSTSFCHRMHSDDAVRDVGPRMRRMVDDLHLEAESRCANARFFFCRCGPSRPADRPVCAASGPRGSPLQQRPPARTCRLVSRRTVARRAPTAKSATLVVEDLGAVLVTRCPGGSAAATSDGNRIRRLVGDDLERGSRAKQCGVDASRPDGGGDAADRVALAVTSHRSRAVARWNVEVGSSAARFCSSQAQYLDTLRIHSRPHDPSTAAFRPS